jgi:hypothetical protein
LRPCAAIAVLFAVAVEHSVVICTDPHSPLRMTGASPEGHAQENAAGVRPSPGVAGFGSGLPGIPARTTATLPARQKRHSEIGPLKNRLQERVALRRHPSHSGPGLSPQSTPGGQHPLDPPTAERR